MKVSLQCAAPGKVAQLDNESGRQGNGEGEELFLSTLIIHLHLLTKHEMTVISNAPHFISLQQATGIDFLTFSHSFRDGPTLPAHLWIIKGNSSSAT